MCRCPPPVLGRLGGTCRLPNRPSAVPALRCRLVSESVRRSARCPHCRCSPGQPCLLLPDASDSAQADDPGTLPGPAGRHVRVRRPARRLGRAEHAGRAAAGAPAATPRPGRPPTHPGNPDSYSSEARVSLEISAEYVGSGGIFWKAHLLIRITQNFERQTADPLWGSPKLDLGEWRLHKLSS